MKNHLCSSGHNSVFAMYWKWWIVFNVSFCFCTPSTHSLKHRVSLNRTHPKTHLRASSSKSLLILYFILVSINLIKMSIITIIHSTETINTVPEKTYHAASMTYLSLLFLNFHGAIIVKICNTVKSSFLFYTLKYLASSKNIKKDQPQTYEW